MISYTVNIAVDPPGMVPEGGSVGNFVFTPALLHVEPGDQITWTCNLPFQLVFKMGTPVDEVDVAGCESDQGFKSKTQTVRTVRGQFHYAVAVWTGSRIFMDAACASISVN